MYLLHLDLWCGVREGSVLLMLAGALSCMVETFCRCLVTLGCLHMLTHEELKTCLEILSV